MLPINFEVQKKVDFSTPETSIFGVIFNLPGATVPQRKNYPMVDGIPGWPGPHIQ